MSLTKRRTAAKKYKPAVVKLLVVAEAPPCTEGQYFYFPKVDRHDWLFRYVWEGLTGEKPERDEKPHHLAALHDSGLFLIDLHEAIIAKPKITDLQPEVPGLLKRCRALRPKKIILIKHSVYDAAFGAMRAEKLPVIDERIPFPASGQQKKFLTSFRRAVNTAGFMPRLPG